MSKTLLDAIETRAIILHVMSGLHFAKYSIGEFSPYCCLNVKRDLSIKWLIMLS